MTDHEGKRDASGVVSDNETGIRNHLGPSNVSWRCRVQVQVHGSILAPVVCVYIRGCHGATYQTAATAFSEGQKEGGREYTNCPCSFPTFISCSHARHRYRTCAGGEEGWGWHGLVDQAESSHLSAAAMLAINILESGLVLVLGVYLCKNTQCRVHSLAHCLQLQRLAAAGQASSKRLEVRPEEGKLCWLCWLCCRSR